MKMRVLVWVLAAGCGAAAPPPAPAPRVTPHPPRAAYVMLPGELGDPGALDHIPHHARVVRLGPARFTPDGEVIASERDNDVDLVVPVLGETRTHVRVVSDDDDAHLAMWIDRADLAHTVVARVQLADEQGVTPADTGVWLDAGAEIELGAARDGLRQVSLHDATLRASGWIPDTLVGTVWVGPRPEGRLDGDEHLVAKGAVLHAGPGEQAPVIATLLDGDGGNVIAEKGAWTLVELTRAGVRVRGFVPSRQVGKDPLGMGLGTMGGGGYGISDTDRVQVPAGTCLYESAGGQVVGVNTETRERYGFAEQGVARVYVHTPWGLVLVTLAAAGGTWESCASGR